jgi:hypothetical protein
MSLSQEIIYGTKSSVEPYLRAGAELNAIDEYGYTPLIQAAIMDNDEIAALLIKYGADTNLPDLTGHTALHWAVDFHNMPLCQHLLEHGANANAYTLGGQPVLTYPLLREQQDLKQLLYSYGASLPFTQDFINTKLIGHRYQLIGGVDIVTYDGKLLEIDFEGFYIEFTVSIIKNSLERFIRNYAARHLRPFFPVIKKIIQSYSVASSLIRYQNFNINYQDYIPQITSLLDQEMIMIPMAHHGHALTYLYYRNILIKCDRSIDEKNDGTVAIYEIGDTLALTPQLIMELLYKKQTREFIHDGIKELLDLKLLGTLPIPHQITGNCSWANLEACIPAMLYLYLKYEDRSIATAINTSPEDAAIFFYDEWVEWDKDRALEECILSFESSNKTRRAAKAAVLAAVLAQSCVYPVTRNLERAERILPILMQPQYLYILKSYIEVFYKERRHAVGKNLEKLLDDCGYEMPK